ncbi:MAG: neutral/alkaline non-lysosomal ceramidase N-terminal domain-containing protein [Verrucomicrobia bacterium]|nr:neutral/alkaline non-lysosomal ceramidase N-terminal domain-containing protein [Verrucomicrobiota bacterium]
MKPSSLLRLVWCIVLSFAFSLAATLASGAQPPRVFKAGAATSNITPFLGSGIVGGWTTPAATQIHDELHARCLVLDDGTTRLAFAVCDNVSISREVFDEAKRLIHATTGLPTEQMLVSATHTHSGPSARGESGFNYGKPLDDYQVFLARRIADGVQRAIHNLAPARIGWGAGRLPQHLFNRRWHMKPGTPMPNPFGGQDQVVMNPGVGNPNLLKPAGPTDPEVSFLSLQTLDGRPLALLANYSLHYVGGVGAGHISADYFAVFCDRIQQLLGADRQDPPFVGIMSNGTCGDVNNINFLGPRETRAPYEKMRLVANDVAQEVFRVYQAVRHLDWVELKAAQAELPLKVRRPTPELVERAQQILARPDTVSPAHRHEKAYAERTVQMLGWPEQINVLLQAFRIGDLGIAAIPFETFAETGLEIKAKSPLKPAFTIELANGGYGYLPTPEQHELGGYETWLGTNRVEKEASRKIVAKLLELLAASK